MNTPSSPDQGLAYSRQWVFVEAPAAWLRAGLPDVARVNVQLSAQT